MQIKTTTFKEYKEIINNNIKKAELLQSCWTWMLRVRYDYMPPTYQEKWEFIVWDKYKVEEFNNFPIIYNDKGFLLYSYYKEDWKWLKNRRKKYLFIRAFWIFEEYQNKWYWKKFLEELIKIADWKEIVVDTFTPSLIHLTNKYWLTLFPRDRNK